MQKPMKQLRSKFHSFQSWVHNIQIYFCHHSLSKHPIQNSNKQNKTETLPISSFILRIKSESVTRSELWTFLSLRIHLIPRSSHFLCGRIFLKPNILPSATGPLYMLFILLRMFSSPTLVLVNCYS